VGNKEILETYLKLGSNTSETDIFPHGQNLLTSVIGACHFCQKFFAPSCCQD